MAAYRDRYGGIIPARAGFTAERPCTGRRYRDHPRSRGVYGVGLWMVAGRRGSSPLARGLQEVSDFVAAVGGIIPARAGFTRRGAGQERLRRDHPRSRGVYAMILALNGVGKGSSPLARGLRIPHTSVPRGFRIIPARAGFTGRRRWCRRPPRDHPRSRGVYTSSTPAPMTSPGSSPLARGLRRVRRGLPGDLRIIPARAGFTACRGGRATGPWDHPRSRGVYPSTSLADSTDWGSSPLARGLLPAPYLDTARGRIIPARAGFTRFPRRARLNTRDHPRSRGVYRAASALTSAATGSSPLARGLPIRPPAIPRGRRIIPARAGFTNCPTAGLSPSSDHPRSRGVYFPAAPA